MSLGRIISKLRILKFYTEISWDIFIILRYDMAVSKNNGTPKMDGENNEKPY